MQSLFLFRKRGLFLFLILAALSCFLPSVYAKETTKKQAISAASGWLKFQEKPMGRKFGGLAGDVKTVEKNNLPLYHIVDIQGEGYVILSGDDEIEPVIAFSSTGFFREGSNPHLTAILEKDLTARFKRLKDEQKKTSASAKSNQTKWDRYIGLSLESTQTKSRYPEIISDVWVEPLVKSKWGQADVCDINFYNRFTPSNYVCGCVSTAISQIMRYHQWPISPVGIMDFTVQINGAQTTLSTHGGDGQGGAYDWDLMPYVPDCSQDPIDLNMESYAVGALCYDVGIAVNMSYSSYASGALSANGRDALEYVFGYSNAIYGNNYPNNIGDPLPHMANSNLDAGLPVYLGISGAGGGHAIICDGYGFNDEVMYHHLNMGWDGAEDLWYQLPDINMFSIVDECMYNIYTHGNGEIVSGRVKTLEGDLLKGIEIVATDGLNTYTDITDDKGIYAITHLPSNTDYTFSINAEGYNPAYTLVHVGKSLSDSTQTGNQWGVDFELQINGPHPDMYEDDDSLAEASKAQTNGPSQFRSLYPEDDVDYIEFNINWISLVEIETANYEDKNIRLELFNADGSSTPIKTTSKPVASLASIDCILDEGKYYLKVATEEPGDFIEQYSVSIISSPVNIDINGDYHIDMLDLLEVFSRWLDTCSELDDFCSGADIDSSGIVDNKDYALINTYWQKELAFIESFESGDLTKWNWYNPDADWPWVTTRNASYAGDFSAKSASIEDNESTSISIEVDAAFNAISFFNKVSCEQDQDFLKFYIDEKLLLENSGEIDWQEYVFALTPGPHVFTWQYSKDHANSVGADAAWLDMITMFSQFYDTSSFDFEEEYLDYSGWNNYGLDVYGDKEQKYAWVFDNENSSSGDICLKTPQKLAFRDRCQAVIELETEVTASVISFDFMVSSEAKYDKLVFYIDDTLKGEWSGEVDWTTAQFPILPGNHVLKWKYQKDGSGSKGQDRAWIDNVRFINQ
ncbi:Streptopain precursor [Limihaloglobus sulfuriphilus]|uniref:Streptopain n=1 Tax=Limihaloglobus sulfuriphilus TaxID=1851148 RepID=A0A1Q2MIW3_9BACT|nr:C10 family peptidase [Limihaloglobus sulfuriphilus]AQQ72222.1 Streptopain precursor [Limihaloglobus sulfuriphilus]